MSFLHVSIDHLPYEVIVARFLVYMYIYLYTAKLFSFVLYVMYAYVCNYSRYIPKQQFIY